MTDAREALGRLEARYRGDYGEDAVARDQHDVEAKGKAGDELDAEDRAGAVWADEYGDVVDQAITAMVAVAEAAKGTDTR